MILYVFIFLVAVFVVGCWMDLDRHKLVIVQMNDRISTSFMIDSSMI